MKGLIINEQNLISVLTQILVNEAKDDTQMTLLILRALNNFLLSNGHILLRTGAQSHCNLFQILRLYLINVQDLTEYRHHSNSNIEFNQDAEIKS